MYGAQGQNRTADTGIFNANKINNLLILLKQAIRGTVRQNQVDSMLLLVWSNQRGFGGVPRTHQKPIKNFYQQTPRIRPSRRAVRACGGQDWQPLDRGEFAGV
jgi:hypothetical protein